MKDIRTDVGEDARISAGAVVGEARELIVPDLPEVVLGNVLTVRGVGAEPGGVSRRASQPPDRLKVFEGDGGIFLGVGSGDVEVRLVFWRATGEGSPLIAAAGDGEITGERDLSNTLNGCVEVLEDAVGIDVGKKVRRLNGVVSSAGSSEVVRGGHWW